MENNELFRIAIVVSHPIQHFCPQYISFSRLPGVKVKLFFASMLGYKKYVDKNFGQEIAWNNLRLEEFDHVFLNGDNVLPSGKELDAPSLDSELSMYKPDALISYGYFQKVQRRAHRWANGNKVPIAYITDAENRQQRPLWKKIAKWFYLRWYFNKINYFFTVGDANEAYYKSYGVPPDRFIRMHYPIDIEVYREAFKEKEHLRKEIRAQYHIPDDMFLIAVVGKLVEWKNQSHLIDLLAILEKKGKKAHVFILGSGPTMEQLKRQTKTLIENVVHFAGFVDPLALPSYYAASDLYLHPAKIEPHSLAISEAIYMGCPVVLSDRCGSYGETDDVQVGKNGFVYKFGDIEGMARYVVEIMDNETRRQDFSQHSHRLAEKFQERSHKHCIYELMDKIKQPI